MVVRRLPDGQRFADRENDITYITLFQGHFKVLCNINLCKKSLILS